MKAFDLGRYFVSALAATAGLAACGGSQSTANIPEATSIEKSSRTVASSRRRRPFKCCTAFQANPAARIRSQVCSM